MAGEYTLSIASGYIERLLANSRIEKHLEKHHRDILGELRALLAELKPQKEHDPVEPRLGNVPIREVGQDCDGSAI